MTALPLSDILGDFGEQIVSQAPPFSLGFPVGSEFKGAGRY